MAEAGSAIADPETADTAALLGRFVAAFRRGIEREVAAMRGAGEAASVTLSGGEALGGQRYGFTLAEPCEPLMAGGEATLRAPHGEQRVILERIEELRIVVVAAEPVDVTAQPLSLAVAPWFLYERLLLALGGLEVGRHAVDLALALFGKRPARRSETALRCEHGALNESQRAAVQLCSDSELAFVWGPPGTGKTATLVHVIEELRAQDRRVLLASTTNAAIDQVLAKLAARPWCAAAVEGGAIVRLGRSDAETFGAELGDVVSRLGAAHRGRLERLRARLGEVEQLARYGAALAAELEVAAAPQQSLFAAPAPRLSAAALARVLGPGLGERVAVLPAVAQRAVLAQRLARLQRVKALAKERAARCAAALRDLEARVVGEAQVVLCTLAQVYLSPLVKEQRFDVLIAEEAGMAVLPALFHAACLCREKAIMVGDPRQLPPIVQSREPVVQRAIGRSVFELAAGEPARAGEVAMLEVQYRMHPVIGGLVGRLFYDGRLRHGADAAPSEAIAARGPYPGQPVVVVDTAGRTACRRSAKGASRVNEASAELTAALALEAAAAGAGSVAVITPYAAQAREIRTRVAARGGGAAGGSGAIECSTIHRFQGRECDVVILDLVDAAPMRPGILLSGSRTDSDACNLLNVSLSRARGKLAIVADVSYFEAHAPGGIVAAILREAVRDGYRTTR